MGRTVEEYRKWLIDNTREQLDFVLLDLICLSHQAFSDFINSASDTEKVKAIYNETLKSLNEKHYHAMKESNYYWVERTPESTVDETVEKVEQHFRFAKKISNC